MKKLMSIFILFAFTQNSSFAAKCTYEAQPDSLKVTWTAFKTSAKVAVSGSLKTRQDFKAKKAKTLAASLIGSAVSLNTKSVESGNPARDQTLTEAFFDQLMPAAISGVLKSLDEKNKSLIITVTLGKIKKDISFTYALDESGAFTAKGQIDLIDLGAKSALDSLHQKCLELHKGKDGISKTWSEVDITLTATIHSSCK